MLYYPSVTRIKPLAVVQRERILPTRGEVLVRRGQELTPAQVVVRAAQEPGFFIVNGSELLDVSWSKMRQYLVTKEGETVREGMPLLRKPGLLGGGKVVRSPVTGIVFQVNRGRIVLQVPSPMVELRAIMPARVTAVYPDQGALLETVGATIEGLWDSGHEGAGKIRVISPSPEAALGAEALHQVDLRGYILVAGRLADMEALQAVVDSGLRGLIVGSMPAGLCRVASTFQFPIIVTDGVGERPMAGPIYDLLEQSQEREVCLFSRATAPRGSRPEIVIPLPSAMIPGADREAGEMITPGQPVRILRPPYAGTIGTVTAVYQRRRTSASGASLPGAEVALPDGQTVFVPYLNLDLINGPVGRQNAH